MCVLETVFSVPPRVARSYGRLSTSNSQELLEEHDSAEEEYEYMNNQNLPLRHIRGQRCRRTASSRSYTFQYPSANHLNNRSSIQGSESSGGLSQSSSDERSRSNGDLLSSEAEYDLDQYEYMDIRSGSGGAASKPAARAEILRTGSYIDHEEEQYHYTNHQPILRRSLMLQGLVKGEGKVNEYEEMDSVVAGASSGSEYHNLYEAGKQDEAQASKVRSSVNVCSGAGTGKEGSDKCYDNPDYWLSRSFSKANVVTT